MSNFNLKLDLSQIESQPCLKFSQLLSPVLFHFELGSSVKQQEEPALSQMNWAWAGGGMRPPSQS